MYSFKLCLYNFEDCPEGVRLVDHFEELSVFEEFHKASDLEIRIAICLSDFDSPFLKINDIEHKVKAILEFFGAMDMYDDVIGWKNENIINITSTYLQMQSKHDYTRWWTLNRLYYELQRELNKPKEPGEDINDYVKRKLLIEKTPMILLKSYSGMSRNYSLIKK